MASYLARRDVSLSDALSAEPQIRTLGALVADYDGAAIWIDGAGAVSAINAFADPLRDEDGLAPGVAALGAEARVTGAVQNAQIALGADEEALRRYDLTAIPSSEGVLILGRDTSAEANLIRALKGSRALFRDVAMCSPDFAFETCDKGLFTWIGPKGALGYAPQDLLGRSASSLLSGPATAAGDPFASHFGVEEEPYCLTDAHGAPRAVRITAAPVLDGLGRWKGMRGVARDVTQSLVMRNRLTATDRILRAMSEDLEPGDLGAVAAEAIAQSCEAAAVWLFASGGECAGTYGAQACLSDMVLEIEGRLRRDQSDAPMVFSAGEVSGLGLALRSKKSVAGVLMIARGHGAAMFSPDSLALTRELTPLLVALLRGFGPQRPHAPDRRDALTGLANKAGYEALAPGWIAAARREGRSGCVLLIDCDHFKAINACLGHQAGDAFLAETAALLRREAGPGDLCFRLEGDVFAVLQQDADEAAAVARAEAIARGFRAVSRKLSLALSVTPSIGVAPVAPALTASAVLDRAREGLQAAKRAGRNRIGAARDGEGGVLLRHCPKA